MDDTPLIEVDFVPPGTAMRVEVQGYPPLAVFNVDGGFFVCDDTCSHGQASLSDGVIEGDTVECPWHNGVFCLRTGAAKGHPAVTPIRVYPAHVRDGQVCIAVSKDAL